MPTVSSRGASRGIFRGGRKGPRCAHDARVCGRRVLLLACCLAPRRRRRTLGDAARPGARGAGAREIGRSCAASSARTRRSTIPRPRWRTTCAAPCASGSPPATATPQVMDFMVARYGDYVLLKPPFKPGTWLLWLGAPAGPAGRRRRPAARRPPAPRRPTRARAAHGRGAGASASHSPLASSRANPRRPSCVRQDDARTSACRALGDGSHDARIPPRPPHHRHGRRAAGAAAAAAARRDRPARRATPRSIATSSPRSSASAPRARSPPPSRRRPHRDRAPPARRRRSAIKRWEPRHSRPRLRSTASSRPPSASLIPLFALGLYLRIGQPGLPAAPFVAAPRRPPRRRQRPDDDPAPADRRGARAARRSARRSRRAVGAGRGADPRRPTAW